MSFGRQYEVDAPTMIEVITKRFSELLAQGESLVARMPRDYRGYEHWLRGEQVADYNAWLLSCANLLQVAATASSHYVAESTTLLTETKQPAGIMSSTVVKMLGVLKSAAIEWSGGLMRSIEYMVAAETFDDFLDHAAQYHKGGKRIEGAVLASAVFEDTIKKLCAKHSIPAAGMTLDPLIDALATASVFTSVKAKRAKTYSGLRNHALHAEWDKFDLKDLGQMIEGIRELIEEYL